MAKETRPNRLPLCIMLADGNHMAGVLLERIVYWGPHGNAVIPTADGKWIANDRRWWMQEARLLVIAFEDIGVASPGALVNAVTACTDPAWRKQAGGNTAVVSSVARMLADAPKDRSSDYLICTARGHPSLAQTRQHLTALPVHARIDMATDATLPVTVRATAAWYASGIE
jgi:hypothetical protein